MMCGGKFPAYSASGDKKDSTHYKVNIHRFLIISQGNKLARHSTVICHGKNCALFKNPFPRYYITDV